MFDKTTQILIYVLWVEIFREKKKNIMNQFYGVYINKISLYQSKGHILNVRCICMGENQLSNPLEFTPILIYSNL